MDFHFTEEQAMLRDTLASYLAENHGFERRQAIVGQAPGWSPALWKPFAEELGILGAAFPEALGGLGGGAVENMIIMEELGRALSVEPYLATAVIGGGFLKHSGHAGAADLTQQVIDGSAVFAFAQAEPQGRYDWANLKTTAVRRGGGWTLNGRKAVVVGAPWASHLIVTARTGGAQRDRDGVSVFLVDRSAPGVTLNDYATIDGARAADVVFEDVALGAETLIGPEGHALPLIEKVIDEAIVATCAEACGVLRRLHDDTVDYTKQRKQFGAPIASFQVLQHRMVDMFIHLEQAVSMTYMATHKLDAPDAERARYAAAAKVQVGKACRFIGQNAIQLHGGMGVTDELAVGHYFKRATLIESAFGSTDHHLARYEALSLRSEDPR
jgi:alkylation response protein AidB-like acyl-CoA dehydrogenase